MERQNGSGRGDVLRSAVRAGITPILARAAATVEAERGRGAKGQLYRSFGDGYTRAFELAVTPAIFGFMGYGVDRWLGIVPVMTLILALTAFLTLLLRTWSGYVRQMESLERAGPWAKATKPIAATGSLPAEEVPA